LFFGIEKLPLEWHAKLIGNEIFHK